MRPRHRLGSAFCAVGLLVVVMRSVAAAEPVALPIVTTVFQGARYATCRVDPARQDVRLYWDDSHGHVLGNFTALQRQVASEGGKLLFAANAGMFDPTNNPVGLFVQDGNVRFPLNLADGPGNFYLKPNGVFFIDGQRKAHVLESGDYATQLAPPLWATQSGPLLVGGGDINPEFTPDSKNRKIRSGVGVTRSGEVIFALSKQPVTFYEFAGLFRVKFQCPHALYLDGDISDFWTPGMKEAEGQHHFGPMIGVVADPSHEGVTATPSPP
jgi:uncharacterized protein YigE (DUF2233 family)